MKNPLVFSRGLKKIGQKQETCNNYAFFGGPEKLCIFSVAFGEQENEKNTQKTLLFQDANKLRISWEAKKLCIFGGRPWEAKISVLQCTMHIFCIVLFDKNMPKICILQCKIDIFASQGLPPKMHNFFGTTKKCIIFLRPGNMRIFCVFFFGLQKNAYVFVFFSCPSKMHLKKHMFFCPPPKNA